MQSAESSNVEQELILLEKNYCDAQINKNKEFFVQLLDERYTQISSRGVLQGKADVLAALADNNSAASSCAQSNVQVRLYGDTAVVTGQTNAAGIYRGTPFQNRLVLWTDTFVRRGGRWHLIATQSTAMQGN